MCNLLRIIQYNTRFVKNQGAIFAYNTIFIILFINPIFILNFFYIVFYIILNWL